MIAAGALDQRVVIESPTVTQDALGGEARSWATFATAWARAVSQKGDESFAVARENARRTVRFKLRWLAGVKPTMRITWNGDVFDIADVDESLRRAGELWITATARVA